VPVHFSKNSEWDSLVSGEQQLVATDFWTQSCPYCRAFKPVFESVRPRGQDIGFKNPMSIKCRVLLQNMGHKENMLSSFSEGKELGEVVVGYIPKDNFKKDIDKIVTSNPASCLANLYSVKPSASNTLSMLNGREAE
jgi:hypothetical protein